MAKIHKKNDLSDVDDFFRNASREVKVKQNELAHAAVQYAVENGAYHDVTGNLRRSNRYEIESDGGIALINDAEYASDVEARGEDVLGNAALELERMCKEEFER